MHELNPNETRAKWYVLHVKPRTEKKTAVFLESYRCWHYLPTWIKTTRRQRRKVRTELVLFPGYVFTRLSAAQKLQMAQTNLIVRFIDISNPRQTIHQLRMIRAAGRLGPVAPTEHFVSTDFVKVKSGPFFGLSGYVKTVAHGGTKLIINIDILGQAVAVDIQAADCEKIN